MANNLGIPQNILDQFEREMNVKISSITDLQTGMSNRLYKLVSQRQSYLLKMYANDDESRLKREYPALSYLPTVGFDEVPKGIMVDYENGWAIYTFLEGGKKTAQEMNHNDLVAIANYVNRLQKITASQVDVEILPAHMACFAIQDYLNNMDLRLSQYKKTVENGKASNILKQFDNEYQPQKVVKKSIDNILRNMDESKIKQEIEIKDRRLSPVDLGPHNMLFDNEKVNFLDFERFGWDDPRRLVAEFLNHDQTVGISDENKEFFREYYKKSWNMPEPLRKDFDLIVDLFEVDWLTIIIFSVTDKKIKTRKFSNPNFVLDEYLLKQTDKMAKRIDKLNSRYG